MLLSKPFLRITFQLYAKENNKKFLLQHYRNITLANNGVLLYENI